MKMQSVLTNTNTLKELKENIEKALNMRERNHINRLPLKKLNIPKENIERINELIYDTIINKEPMQFEFVYNANNVIMLKCPTCKSVSFFTGNLTEEEYSAKNACCQDAYSPYNAMQKNLLFKYIAVSDDLIVPTLISYELNKEDLSDIKSFILNKDMDKLKEKYKNARYDIKVQIDVDSTIVAYTDKHKIRFYKNGKVQKGNQLSMSSRNDLYSSLLNPKDISEDLLSMINLSKDDLTDVVIEEDVIMTRLRNYKEPKRKTKKKKNVKKDKKEYIKINIDKSGFKHLIDNKNIFIAQKDKKVLDTSEYNILCLGCGKVSKYILLNNGYYDFLLKGDINNFQCNECGRKQDDDTYIIETFSEVFVINGVNENGEYYEKIYEANIAIDDKYDALSMDNIMCDVEEKMLSIVKNNKDNKPYKVKHYIPRKIDKNNKTLLYEEVENITRKILKERNLLYKSRIKYDLRNIETIANSNIKYSGFDYVINSIRNEQSNSFYNSNIIFLTSKISLIDAWIEYPNIEKLIKTPYTSEIFLTDLSNIEKRTDAKNIDINNVLNKLELFDYQKGDFNIRKHASSIIKDLYKEPIYSIIDEDEYIDFSKNVVLSIKKLDDNYKEQGEDLHKEEIHKVFQTTQANLGLISNFIDDLIEINKSFNISYKRSAEYLQNVFWNQCMYPFRAINIWKDYLSMAKDLEYDFSIKSVVFPSSLHKEHDIAVFTYNKLSEKAQNEKLLEFFEKYKDYEFSNDKYIISVPKSAKDIANEGKRLKHCVASYVTRLSEERMIMFLRHKDKPKQSFYTLEVYKEQIVQARGFANTPATKNKELMSFIKDFAKSNNLSVNI